MRIKIIMHYFWWIERKYEPEDGNHENMKKKFHALNRKIDFMNKLSSTLLKT